MSDGSTIEWLSMPGFKPASWNAVRGCTRVSSGCTRCYAETLAARFSDPGQWGHGYASRDTGRWTGEVNLIHRQLDLPLKWRTPRCVFVNSTSDLFHEKLSDDDISRVFGVMGCCPQHRFMVLTKRPERMREFLLSAYDDHRGPVYCSVNTEDQKLWNETSFPIPNVWLGVSVEDQATANERIPLLLDTPAALRFVSYEPALGPVDFTEVYARMPSGGTALWNSLDSRVGDPGLDWIIAGSESGRNPRRYGIHWFSAVKAQCEAAGVPFFMKQITDHCGRKIPFKDWPSSLRVREFPEVTS